MEMKKNMRRVFMGIGLMVALGIFAACGQERAAASQDTQKTTVSETQQAAQPKAKEEAAPKEDTMNKKLVKITVNGQVLHARLEDNAATRALVKKMPMTLPMSDLYSREMCYRYGAGGLPTDKLRSDHYEVGDIAYWPPRGSLVILYAQNGEEFERQQIGHIDSGVEIFRRTGDADVTFELEG